MHKYSLGDQTTPKTLESKRTSVLLRVLPPEVVERVMYSEVVVLVEEKSKQFVTVVLTDTELHIYPQRLELNNQLLMRIPLAVMVNVTKESDTPTFLAPDVAMYSLHIFVQYRTRDSEGTCDLYTFQTPTQLLFHLNRLWCHCLLGQLLKRTLGTSTSLSKTGASPRDQVLASEAQWRKAITTKERMKACAHLTEYLRHNHIAILEYYKTSLYCFVLDELRSILTPASSRFELHSSSPTGARRTHQRNLSLPFVPQAEDTTTSPGDVRKLSVLDAIARQSVHASINAAVSVPSDRDAALKRMNLEYVIAMLELLHVTLTFAPQPSCQLSILQLRKPYTVDDLLHHIAADYIHNVGALTGLSDTQTSDDLAPSTSPLMSPTTPSTPSSNEKYGEQAGVLNEILISLLYALEQILEHGELEGYGVRWADIVNKLSRSDIFLQQKLPLMLTHLKELYEEEPSAFRTITIFEHVSVLELLVNGSYIFKGAVKALFSAELKFKLTDQRITPQPGAHTLDHLAAQRLKRIRDNCLSASISPLSKKE